MSRNAFYDEMIHAFELALSAVLEIVEILQAAVSLEAPPRLFMTWQWLGSNPSAFCDKTAKWNMNHSALPPPPSAVIAKYK
jgi:hypothetical protein